MCSSKQIWNTAPGMLIRSSQDNEALNSSKETLVVLGNTFNSIFFHEYQKKLQDICNFLESWIDETSTQPT